MTEPGPPAGAPAASSPGGVTPAVAVPRHAPRALWLWLALVAVMACDAWLFARMRSVQAEAHRARTDAFGTSGAASDAALAAQQARLRSILEKVRAQAAADPAFHLNVEVDSGTVTLERDGLVLRTMVAELGPESVVGVAPDTQRLAVPRGVRTVLTLVPKGAPYELPAWLWRERGLEVPADRRVKGALGSGAAFLEGGTLIYARTAVGPLADSLYVWPGAIRLSDEDLKAVLPNLKPGVKVYLF